MHSLGLAETPMCGTGFSRKAARLIFHAPRINPSTYLGREPYWAVSRGRIFAAASNALALPTKFYALIQKEKVKIGGLIGGRRLCL
jgi:hypothetical protein